MCKKCSDAIIERIDRGDWNGKVIMEANVNGFFFTYNNIHQLPRNCTYIIVDKYYEVLAMYKELFERLFQGWISSISRMLQNGFPFRTAASTYF